MHHHLGLLFNQAILPDFTKFVQMPVKDPKVDFLTVRTLSLALAPTGILSHLHVVFKRRALKHLTLSRQLSDNGHWVGD